MRFRFHQPSATPVVTEIKCEGGVREHSVGQGKFRIPLDGARKEFGGGLERLQDVAIARAKAFQVIVVRLGIAAIAVASRERHAKAYRAARLNVLAAIVRWLGDRKPWQATRDRRASVCADLGT
jgi:hypothetical protein